MPQGELQRELDLLYRAAGRPSYRSVSGEIRRQNTMPDTVSHETVGAILRADVRVRWSKWQSVITQLAMMAVHRPDPAQEVRRFHALWLAKVDSLNPEQAPDRSSDVESPAPPIDDPEPSAPDQTPWTAPPSVDEPQGVIGGAPQRNVSFTGRRSLLEVMETELALDPWKPLVLHGLSGVGKTQLALEYLHRHAGEYEVVGWITAEDPSQLTYELARLGERLEWSSGYDLAQNARTTLARLESGMAKWLIVLDNAAAPDEVEAFLPQAGGHLIVTTRDAAWLEIGRPVEVDVFARQESIELLSARGHSIAFEEADLLADRLGDLPLALEQVAAMQSATRTPVRDYLRQLDERALQVLKSTAPGDHREPVTVAFTVAAERLRQESAGVGKLLELISCMSAEPISLTLLSSGSRVIPAPLGRLLEQPQALEDAIRRLRRYGLVKVVNDGQTLQVHRLVQEIVRGSLTDEARAEAYTNARLLLIAANPGRPTDPLAWDIYARIRPHLRRTNLIEATDPGARQTLIDQAHYLHEIGDYEGSRRLTEDALDGWAERGIEDDVQVFECLRRHVAALTSLGRYAEAAERAEDGWNRARAHPDCGRDHRTTLGLADVVARLRRVSGDYRSALTWDSQCVEAHRRTRGDLHPDTLRARNNLAVSLRAVGDFQSAYGIDEELAEQQRSRVGSGHQRTLLSNSNLARDLYGLGRFGAALDLQRSTWSAFRDRLPARHPHVLTAWHSVVQCLRKTGDYGKAIDEGLRLHLICQADFGSDHELTLATKMTYANTLCAAGQVYKAWNQAVDVVDRYRRVYGERNPLTLAAATNQAIVLRAVGERRQARQIGEVSFRALQQVVGPDHPFTIVAAMGVANDMILAHEHDVALRNLAGILEDARRVRGDRHPDTLVCAVNLGRLMQDDPARRGLLETSMSQLRDVHGTGHPLIQALTAGKLGECDIEPPPV